MNSAASCRQSTTSWNQAPKGLPNPSGIVRPRDPDDTTIPNTAIEKWTAKVDPPAEPIIFTKIDKLILTSPVRSSGDTIFPSANSAFVAIGRNSNPLSLNAVQLPDSATLQRLANKDLAPKMLLKSGMSVSLNIQLGGISGHPNLVSELTKSWTDRFKQRGITVAPGQKMVLFARAKETNSGKPKEFVISKSRFGLPPSRFGGTGNVVARETIQQTTIKCRVVIGLGNQAFNERKNEVTNFSTNGYFSTSFRLKIRRNRPSISDAPPVG